MSTRQLYIVHKYLYFQQLDKETNATNFEEKLGNCTTFDVYFEFTIRNQEKDLASIKMIISTQRNQLEVELLFHTDPLKKDCIHATKAQIICLQKKELSDYSKS